MLGAPNLMFVDGRWVSPEVAKQIDEQKKRDANVAQGLNPDGSPKRPEWQSIIDNTTGQLDSKYQLNVSALDPTQWEGYSKYRQEALRTGPSAWANLALQQQAAEEAKARDAAARQSLSSLTQGYSQLASRGGLSGGARAQLALQGNRNMLLAGQDVGRTAMLNRLGISKDDESNRVAQLGQLTNYETDIGKYNKTLEGKQKEFNLNNVLREIEGRRGFDLDLYKERMRDLAATRQADATRNSGGGGK
jgi:hypothetical protein